MRSPACVHVPTHLGSIDQSPCIEQTKAVLVAVVETGSIHPPVCTVVTLRQRQKTQTSLGFYLFCCYETK